MSRPDPALPLVYGDRITPGRNGYASADALREAEQEGRTSQSWWLGPEIVSCQIAARLGGGIWKRRDKIETEDAATLLPRLERAGVRHPSSWTDCYHQIAPSVPLVIRTWNGLLDWWRGAPWSEARRIGIFGGRWYRYDLRQAYRWAATLGLPDTTTLHAHRRYQDTAGLWQGNFRGDTSALPTVLRDATGPVLVSSEDLEIYRIPFRVTRGVTWDRAHPADFVERTLARLPCPREAGRTFWGRWIARTPLTIKTANGAREMPRNIFANFAWGHLIMHRVRARVWQAAANAAHIHVDEIVVPEPMDCGPDVLGAWREKAVYEQGIVVYRTGHWGGLRERATMQTGVRRGIA